MNVVVCEELGAMCGVVVVCFFGTAGIGYSVSDFVVAHLEKPRFRFVRFAPNSYNNPEEVTMRRQVNGRFFSTCQKCEKNLHTEEVCVRYLARFQAEETNPDQKGSAIKKALSSGTRSF